MTLDLDSLGQEYLEVLFERARQDGCPETVYNRIERLLELGPRLAGSEGLYVRHSRTCASHGGEECDCQPRYQARAYNARDDRRVNRTFGTAEAARRWRDEMIVAFGQEDVAEATENGGAPTRPGYVKGGRKLGTAGRELTRQVRAAIEKIDHEPFSTREIAAILGVANTGPVQKALDRLTGSVVVPHGPSNDLVYTRARET